MKKIIEMAKDSGLVVSIFINRDEPEHCNVGFIRETSENEIMLLSLDKDARPEGFFVLNISSIYRIDMNGRYEQEYQLRSKEFLSLVPDYVRSEESLFIDISKYANKRDLKLWISFYGGMEVGVLGEVVDVNEKALIVNRISEDGAPDGVSYILLDGVDFIACEFGLR